MKHIIYEEMDQYPVCILIKESAMHKDKIHRNYIAPLLLKGIQANEIIVFSLDYNGDKASVTLVKECLKTLALVLNNLGVKLLYVADGNYFKPMAKVKKLEPHYGYLLPCVIPQYEDINVVLGVPYTALFHNPDLVEKLDRTLTTLADAHLGRYTAVGTNVIHWAVYPKDDLDVAVALDSLHQYACVTCDIETFSLKHYSAGIGTIAFAWNKHEGVAFPVDCMSTPYRNAYGDPVVPYVAQIFHMVRRDLLRKFFSTYTGTVIYHGIGFDAKVLAYQLFLLDDQSYERQLYAVEVMTKNIACTKILAYLATNNCVENKLGLKDIAQEYAGNWAKDEIKDIRKIPLEELLRYNLTDALATYYSLDKFMPIVKREQWEVYSTMFLPMVTVLINAELNGMPMDAELVNSHGQELGRRIISHMIALRNSPLIENYTKIVQKDAWIKANVLLKVKVKPESDFDHIKFNPNSDKQLQNLLHEIWKFDVISTTDGGAPAVGAKTLNAHLQKLIREFGLEEHEYNL